jgi:hypothetical protein
VKATAALKAGDPVSAAGAVAVADAHILGVAIQTVANAEDVGVMAIGQIEMVAGGAITALDYVKVGSTGKVLTADAAALAAGKVIGKAVSATTADGQKVTVLVGIL